MCSLIRLLRTYVWPVKPTVYVDNKLFLPSNIIPCPVHQHIVYTFGISVYTTNEAGAIEYLSKIAPFCMSNPVFDLQTVHRAVSELLELFRPSKGEWTYSHPYPEDPLHYLVVALHYNQHGVSLGNSTSDRSVKWSLHTLIIKEIVNAICNPMQYRHRVAPANQFLNIFRDQCVSFLPDVFRCMDLQVKMRSHQEYMQYKEFTFSIFNTIRASMVGKSLLDLPGWILKLLGAMTEPGLLFTRFWSEFDSKKPGNNDGDLDGVEYEISLIGDLLGMHVEPNILSADEYCLLHSKHIASVAELLTRLLADKQEQWLNYIAGSILHNFDLSNSGLSSSLASTYFRFGLSLCLLRITGELLATDDNIMLIDPTYCAQRHFISRIRGMGQVTCLNNANRDFRRPTVQYQLLTELFFMTHRSIDVTFGRSWSTFSLNPTAPDSDKCEHQCLLALKHDPQHRDRLVRFYAATSRWLTQLAYRFIPFHEQHGYAPLHESRVRFPLPDVIDCRQPLRLDLVPIYMVCNIVDYVQFLGDFDYATVITYSAQMADLFGMLLALLDTSRNPNPYLRAYMLRAMAVLVAHDNRPSQYGADLLLVHPHRLYVAQFVVDVYIDLDYHMPTHESLLDLQLKTNVYKIMDRLLTMPEHLAILRQLAVQRSVKLAPMSTFMTAYFIDAIYLLHRIVGTKRARSKLPSMLTARSDDYIVYGEEYHTGDAQLRTLLWEDFVCENDFRWYYETALATCDTPEALMPAVLQTMQLLIYYLPNLYADAALCLRAARFVNYLLMYLLTEYNVAKPDTQWIGMFTICISLYETLSIHVNFIATVTLDRRFYTPRLFTVALEILATIGPSRDNDSYENIANLARRVQQQIRLQQACVRYAPSVFVDETSGELMRDPVIMPMSRKAADRISAVRHLHPRPHDAYTNHCSDWGYLRPLSELRKQIEVFVEFVAMQLSDDDDCLDEADLSHFEMGNIVFLDNLLCKVRKLRFGKSEM